MKYIIALVCFFMSAGASMAQYYGEFQDELHFKMNVGVGSGWNTGTLLSDFRFMDPNGLQWRTPKGYVVNGASIPKWAWSFIGGPYSGNYLPASVIHDYYVDARSRTAHDTHRNFYYGMLANGVPWWKAKTMHWAVTVYTDWDLNAPNSNLVLQITTIEAAQDMQSVLLDIEQGFQAEAAQLRGGALPAAQYEILILENDARMFRQVLQGQIDSAEYNGLATIGGATEIFETINQGTRGFEFMDTPVSLEEDPVLLLQEDAAYSLPSGIPYKVVFDADSSPDGLKEISEGLDSRKFGFVFDGKLLDDPMQYDGSDLQAAMIDAAGIIADTSPFPEVGVQLPSKNTVWGGAGGLVDLSDFSTDRGVIVRFLEIETLQQATPNLPLASYRNFGTLVTGASLEDGTFQINGVAPISAYSGFGLGQ